MSFLTLVILCAGGFFTGIVNAIAGGGALISYPLMLWAGLPPVIANTTSSVAVWPGSLTSAYGYREHLRNLPKKYYIFLIPCLVGGLIGAVILRHTSNESFKQLAPWLIVFAVVLLLFQGVIHKWLRGREGQKIILHRRIILWLIGLFVLLLSIYAGYFGAGFGIIFLAFLGLTELTDIKQMNGLKNLAAVCANITANAYFIIHGLIYWREACFMAVGTLIGGYVGARFAIRLPTKLVRTVIIIAGIIIAAVLFSKR